MQTTDNLHPTPIPPTPRRLLVPQTTLAPTTPRRPTPLQSYPSHHLARNTQRKHIQHHQDIRHIHNPTSQHNLHPQKRPPATQIDHPDHNLHHHTTTNSHHAPESSLVHPTPTITTYTRTRIIPFLHLQPPLFWIGLFKTAHLHHNQQSMTNKIRKFIQQYLFTSYNIPTKQIITTINLNITYKYHPILSNHHISTAHKIIVSSHTTHKQFKDLYTTVTTNNTIGDTLLNHILFFKSFHKDHPPTCTCHTNTDDHQIIFPHDLPTKLRQTIRNLKQPTHLPNAAPIQQVSARFVELLNKLRTLRLHPPRQISLTIQIIDTPPPDLNHNLSLNSHPRSPPNQTQRSSRTLRNPQQSSSPPMHKAHQTTEDRKP